MGSTAAPTAAPAPFVPAAPVVTQAPVFVPPVTQPPAPAVIFVPCTCTFGYAATSCTSSFEVKCVSCFDGFTLSGQDCIRAAANAPAFTLPPVARTNPPTTTEPPTEEPTTKVLDGGFAPPVEETTIEATDAPTVAATEKDLSGAQGYPWQ